MATDNLETVVISNDAVNLLECFHSGFDKMVYTLAEEHARNRRKRESKGGSGGNESAAPDVLEVQQEDVQFAADAVLKALDELNLTESLKSLVKDEMARCYNEKVCNP